MVEVRRFEDDVLVLVEDDYGKTFLSFEPEYFDEKFDNPIDLLSRVSEIDEMDGSFSVVDGSRVVLDCCSSLELHGMTDEPIIYLRSDQ